MVVVGMKTKAESSWVPSGGLGSPLHSRLSCRELEVLSSIRPVAGWEPAGTWTLFCHIMERESEAQQSARINRAGTAACSRAGTRAQPPEGNLVLSTP